MTRTWKFPSLSKSIDMAVIVTAQTHPNFPWLGSGSTWLNVEDERFTKNFLWWILPSLVEAGISCLLSRLHRATAIRVLNVICFEKWNHCVVNKNEKIVFCFIFLRNCSFVSGNGSVLSAEMRCSKSPDSSIKLFISRFPLSEPQPSMHSIKCGCKNRHGV